MPEDSFRDLDPGAREKGGPSAAERLSELDAAPDAEEPRRDEPKPARPGGRYMWVVGVAAAIVIIVVSINSLPNAGRGFRGPQPGRPLPAFAAPSAAGDLDGDANIRQRGEGSPEQGAVPACWVRGPGVVKVCDAPYRHQVVTFVTDGCEDQLDRVEDVRADYPDVSFVGVVSGESRAEVTRLAAGHDWAFPVAADPDNGVFNLYRAGDCPTTTLAYRGGEVRDTLLGPLAAPALAAAVDELRADAERRPE